MKLKFLIIITIIGMFFTTSCSKVNNAKITINNDNTHSSKDINKVISKVKSDFKNVFYDCNCEILNINYDSSNQGIKEWNDTEYYDIIVIEFDFISKKNTETLSKDNTYFYKAYYGKKNQNSSWQRIDWGQG